MTTAAEVDRLTDLLDDRDPTFVHGLDRLVRDLPDHVALTYGPTGEQLTFGELGARTDSVAGQLAALGVGVGDAVSVLSTDPMMATVWMIGIWKAGAIYAPVNYQYTGMLLSYTLDDTSPTLLISDSELIERVGDVWDDIAVRPRVLVSGQVPGGLPFDTGPAESLVEPADRPDFMPVFHTPCSLIYTSGTTGPSKGVVHPHRWITQYTWALGKRLTTDDVVYNDLPMYHVGGAYANVVAGLWAGAGLSLWDRFSPNEFWDRIQSGSCTQAIILDVMIPWLLNKEPRDDDRANPLNKAHMQPLPVRHQEFAQRFGIDTVTAGFGQTESGAPALMIIEECEPGQGTPPELFRGKSQEQIRSEAADLGIPVVKGETVTRKAAMGVAAPFFDVAVLDDEDRPCRPGTAGHWAIRPKLPYLLYTEYLGKPDKTLEANRNYWFHTGDSAIQDEEGFYYFLDRLGDRIRVRGENISSVHVEEILAGHPQVDVAAVVAVASPRSDEDEIVAFIQAAEGAAPTIESLEEYAAANMPKYMRPWQYRFVDELPKTPTNKIEKHKLRQAAQPEQP